MRIAFLGLGNMGKPMTRNLLELGHTIAVYNRTPGKAEALIAMGAREASTVAEVVKDAQVAITMLSDDAGVEAVTYGATGLLQNLLPKAIHLCMSTIGVETSAKLAKDHSHADQGYVAAPVLGRPGAVSPRHLWIVAGGPENQVNRCLPIFDALGRGLTRVGSQAELAHALKLGGSVLTVALVEALSEVLAYGEKAGMDSVDYLRLLNTAIFKSPLIDAYGGVMVRRAYSPAGLTLDLAAKEIQLALLASGKLEAAMPIAALLSLRLEAAAAQGWGTQDLAVLAQACRINSGMEEKASTLQEVIQAVPPVTARNTHLMANPKKTPNQVDSRRRPHQDLATPFTAKDGESQIVLDLNDVTHFDLSKGIVRAWSQEKRYDTSWRSLAEVESTFRQVLFLLIQRKVLLQPKAVLEFKHLFGGRAKVRVGKTMALSVSRAAARRLKEVLGM